MQFLNWEPFDRTQEYPLIIIWFESGGIQETGVSLFNGASVQRQCYKVTHPLFGVVILVGEKTVEAGFFIECGNDPGVPQEFEQDPPALVRWKSIIEKDP